MPEKTGASRPIKFRAWRIDEMLYPDDLREEFHMEFDARIVRKWDEQGLSNQFTMMQFTGLTDGKGNEIYEGDVVTCEGGYKVPEGGRGECEDPRVVKFDEGQWIVECPNCGDTLPLYEYDLREVIGNIYENPELLKEAA